MWNIYLSVLIAEGVHTDTRYKIFLHTIPKPVYMKRTFGMKKCKWIFVCVWINIIILLLLQYNTTDMTAGWTKENRNKFFLNYHFNTIFCYYFRNAFLWSKIVQIRFNFIIIKYLCNMLPRYLCFIAKNNNAPERKQFKAGQYKKMEINFIFAVSVLHITVVFSIFRFFFFRINSRSLYSL